MMTRKSWLSWRSDRALACGQLNWGKRLLDIGQRLAPDGSQFNVIRLHRIFSMQSTAADRAGKLAFAATRSSNFLRPKRKFAELADEAKAAGAAALLLHAPTQDAPFRVPHDLGLLVVTVGAAAGATLQSADGPVRANLVFREVGVSVVWWWWWRSLTRPSSR